MTPIFVNPHGQAGRSLRAVIVADRVRAYRVALPAPCPMRGGVK